MPRRTSKTGDEEGDPATPQAKSSAASPGSIVQGAPLKPIRFVERELTRPDGTTLRVKVPVYPPFRLEERSAPPPAPDARQRPPERRKAS